MRLERDKVTEEASFVSPGRGSGLPSTIKTR